MSKSSNSDTGQELFKLDGNPTIPVALPQALQHVLAMLVGNITPPMLIAATCGLSEADQVILVQAAMLISGITTLLQLYPVYKFGMGLPNVMGVAFAYMPVLTLIGREHGIEAIFGAQLVAGASSILIGLLMGKIRKYFPPIVSGTVVLSIGLSLYGTAVTYMVGGAGAKFAQAAEGAPEAVQGMFGHPSYWIITLVVLVITLGCSLLGKGYVKVSGMLIGIVAGYVLSLIIAPDLISFDTVNKSAFIAGPSILHFKLTFVPTAIISMILMYIVQAVQTIGDVSSTAIGAFKREATDNEIGGAITGQGLCGMIGALIGGLPTDPYSQNVGLIVTTKVVAKKVFAMVGIITLAAGFFPKIGALMTTIPYPVIGGATITVFAAITMSGIELICEQPLNYRNKMIVGISLALGVGVKATVGSLAYFSPTIQNIFGSEIVLSFLVVFLLNLIIPEDNTKPE